MTLHEIILNIPKGYSEVYHNQRKYSVVRTDFTDGKSLKVLAEELGGTDFISFNYYITTKDAHLKPCEMPEQKVVDFLLRSTIIL